MYVVLRVSAVLVSLAACGPGQTCGVERWPVKTGTDSDSSLVNLSAATATTIANLTALPAPSAKPDDSRVQPTETTVFVLNAVLTQYKYESDDSDYHLVLSDAAGKTMIGEIPLPGTFHDHVEERLVNS